MRFLTEHVSELHCVCGADSGHNSTPSLLTHICDVQEVFLFVLSVTLSEELHKTDRRTGRQTDRQTHTHTHTHTHTRKGGRERERESVLLAMMV